VTLIEPETLGALLRDHGVDLHARRKIRTSEHPLLN